MLLLWLIIAIFIPRTANIKNIFNITINISLIITYNIIIYCSHISYTTHTIVINNSSTFTSIIDITSNITISNVVKIQPVLLQFLLVLLSPYSILAQKILIILLLLLPKWYFYNKFNTTSIIISYAFMNYNITSTSTPNSLKISYTFITIITFTINNTSCKYPGYDNYAFYNHNY